MLSEKIKQQLLYLQEHCLQTEWTDALKLRILIEQFEYAENTPDRIDLGRKIGDFLSIKSKTNSPDSDLFIECMQSWEKHLNTWTQSDFFCHPSAIIDEGAEVGEGCKIWHFSHIMSNSQIGKKCNIGQNVVISPGVVLGNGVKVQNNVSLYEGVICEDDVFIGPSAVFTNVLNPRSAVVRKSEFQSTLLSKGCSIGANSTIICGNSIGPYAFIGAGAVVTSNVPAHALMAGIPAKQIGWMDKEGIRLHPDASGKAISAAGHHYQLIKGELQVLD